MIRIKQNKCGYIGFSCRGIPQLDDNMFNSSNELVARLDAEFNKLPIRIKGMVFTEETIDMGWPEGGPHPEVAELTCRSDTDPWSTSTNVSVRHNYLPVEIGGQTIQYPVFGGTSGWADLFNAQVSGATNYFYRNTAIDVQDAETSDVYLTADGAHHGNIYDVTTSVPVFTDTIDQSADTSIEMGPGLLEPMLDTDFDPIGINTIPGWEGPIDALTFNDIVLNGWKAVIDDRIRNIYARLNDIGPIHDLQIEEYTESECENFQILLTAGKAVTNVSGDEEGEHQYSGTSLPEYPVEGSEEMRPMQIGDKYIGRTVIRIWSEQNGQNTVWFWVTKDEEDLNLYEVTGGVVHYDDKQITIAGVNNITAPFFAYLTMTLDGTVPYTDVPAASVPTITEEVEGSTVTRMIQNGDTLPSGGTVSGFTYTVLADSSTVYSWTGENDNGGSIGIITAQGLSETQTADPPVGSIGIGGVRIICSDPENPDALVMYKIYHEDCISEIEKPEAEAEAASTGWIHLSDIFPYGEELMGVEVPYGTETIVVGATPGIVQPVHNIQVHGSTEYRTQSPVDVPTVEAVYNFVHNYFDFTDGDFEQASALATGSTMYADGSTVAIYGFTGATAVPGTVIVADDIKTIVVDGRTWTAQNCVPTAQAVVDYIGNLAFDGMASTVGIIGFTENVPEELWPIPGSTVNPIEGYVQNVQNIYVAGTHAISAYAVPTVDAVYNFIHNIEVEGMTFSSALVTGGTLAEISTTVDDVTTITGYTVTGEPGTCYMATAIPVGSTVAITFDNCAPTVQAVIDYVDAILVDAESGTLIDGGTTEVWAEGGTYTDPVRGLVEVSSQIVVGATPGLSLQAVTSVKAVYDFIHTSETDTPYRALATAGVMGSTTTEVVVEGETSYRGDMTLTGATPGTYIVADNIVTIDGTTADIKGQTTAQDCVPTAQAVVDWTNAFVAGYTATGGTIYVDSTNGEEWTDGSTVFTGIVTVANNIEVAGETNKRNLSPYTVPTVEAVWEFVQGKTVSDAMAGYISVDANGTESLAWAEGSTAYPGIVQSVMNISTGSQNPNAVSPSAVPTVQAVIDYIHGTTITGYDVDDSRANAVYMVADVIAGTVTAPGSTPGTYNVADSIEVVSVEIAGATVLKTAPGCVPTAQAVVDYVKRAEAGVDNGVPSTLTVVNDVVVWITVDGATVPAVRGIVDMTDVVVVASTPSTLARNTVPTTQAVFDFIHSVDGTTARALATIGGMTETISGVTADSYVPGTMNVVGELVGYTDSLGAVSSVPDVVPTADAIVKYIDNLPKVTVQASTAGTLIAGSTTEEWSSIDTAIPGITEVSKNILVDLESPSTAVEAVPSVKAVYDFVHSTTRDAVGSTASRQALVTASTMSVHIQEGGAIQWAIGKGAKPGTCYLVTNIVTINGTTTMTAQWYAPTIKAVVDFIAGYTASVGSFTVTAGVETWTTEALPGIVKVVDGVTIGNSNHRDISSTSVPTTEAVYDFVSTYEAVGGTISAAHATLETWINGGTESAGIVWVSRNIAVHTQPQYRTISHTAVPTVEAVYLFVQDNVGQVVDTYLATKVAVGGTMSITGVGEDIIGATAGVATITRNLDINTTLSKRDESTYVVPTVEAVYEFIHGGTVYAGGNTLSVASALATPTAITTLSGFTGTPGTCRVATNIYVANDSTLPDSYCTVPTVAAVKNYVDQHAPDATYRGPFAADVTAGTISGGDVYFNGNYVAHADAKVSGFATNSTYYCVLTRNSTTGIYGATIGGYTNSIYTASVPVVATNANAVPSVQLHYGVVNIEGRWC